MLCLGTYLTAINNNKSKPVTQKNILGRVMLTIDPCFPASDDALISNLRRGKRNPSEYTIEAAQKLAQDKSQHPDYVRKFQEVLSFIDPNKRDSLKQELIQIILNDDKIHGTTVVDIVSNIDKNNISKTECSLESVLAGILLYVLTATKHGTGKKSATVSQSQLDNLNAPVTDTSAGIIRYNSDIPEDVFREAQDFCLKYEEELGLLPLCQIAFSIDPLHNNVRSMYTDFNRYPQKVKEAILRLKRIPLFSFSKDWDNKAIDHYQILIEKLNLSDARYLYIFYQYFPRTYDSHASVIVSDPNPYIFDQPLKLPKKYRTKDNFTSIGSYIGDYLWCKQNEPTHYVQPPLDYLWEFCRLGCCDESELTFWICRFIISSSFYIHENDQEIEELWRAASIDEQLLKTLEDMYYYALLQLYLLTLSSDDCKTFLSRNSNI